MKQRALFLILAIASLFLLPSTASSQSEKKPPEKSAGMDATDLSVPLKDGAVEFTAAKTWKRKKPRSKIIAHEFSITPARGDEKPGRITVMAAMGSVDANIERWKKQFVPAEGKSIEDVAKIAKTSTDGNEFHIVDIAGTYLDQPSGPFGPKVKQAGYRMLAAIVNVKDEGQFFLKFYGPKKTVDAEEKAFRSFVNSLKIED